MRRLLVSILIVSFLIGLEIKVYAKEFCVSTVNDLNTALSEAANNYEDDVIKLVQGTYQGNFRYSSTHGNKLTIEGGYQEGCQERELDPLNTVLDGGENDRVLWLKDPGGSFVIEGVTIKNGYINRDGGGLYISEGIQAEVRNCVISDNYAADDGAGAYFGALSVVKVEECTIVGNTTGSGWLNDKEGGGLEFDGTNQVYVRNNVIISNYADNYGGGIRAYQPQKIYIENNEIKGNTAYCGGGISIEKATEVVLQNNVITGNKTEDDRNADGGGGEIRECVNVLIDSNLFEGNAAADDSGALALYWNSEQIITNNVFVDNSANNRAGAISVWSDRSDTQYKVYLINNTFAFNSATNNIGAAVIWWKYNNGSLYIYNNIFYENASAGAELYIGNNQKNDGKLATFEIYNNLFTRQDSIDFNNNIDLDPSNLFGNPAFVDAENGDLHLSANSPCIDMGNNAAPQLPFLDKDGNGRITDGNSDGQKVVDIGAYEYGSSKPPVIESFTANPQTGKVPLEVTFTCQASDPDGTIVNYKWDFDGDGQIDETTQQGTVTYTYQMQGTYYAQVIVVDDKGIETISEKLPIQATTQGPKINSFSAEPTSGNAPLTVTFTCDAEDEDGIKEYQWDFDGDGNIDQTTNEGIVEYTYNEPGVYRAKVIVVDNTGGKTESNEIVIEVEENPQSEVYNAAPVTPMPAYTLTNPPFEPAEVVVLSDAEKEQVIIVPVLSVPDKRIGEKVNLYWMYCSADGSWCSETYYLGNVLLLDDTVSFPIITTPQDFSDLEGDFLIYVGFASKVDFLDVVYNYYELILN